MGRRSNDLGHPGSRLATTVARESAMESLGGADSRTRFSRNGRHRGRADRIWCSQLPAQSNTASGRRSLNQRRTSSLTPRPAGFNPSSSHPRAALRLPWATVTPGFQPANCRIFSGERCALLRSAPEQPKGAAGYCAAEASCSALRLPARMEINDASPRGLLLSTEVFHETLHAVLVPRSYGILCSPDFLNDLILHRLLPSTPAVYKSRGMCIHAKHTRCASAASSRHCRGDGSSR